VEVVKGLTNEEVTETEDATFVCQLSKPNQEVTWNLKGKPIKPSDKYIIEVDGDVYKLTIKNCTLEDAAEVTLTNKDCKSNAQLLVTGMLT
jgi:obscurin-RhoGEF protein